ncbi:NYN domain-containing protein [Leucobacter weissii]|uniref:NYN domain-containing protein n=1 Tax=Leucobacter weissii TaxID=1983706 RepID=A0A939MJE9_9MICO|nr:NYN domain-containing protein [Leucobacter weissii]MBO1901095.1 NYN domain-containing protein [Leucobacter weissii]
MAAWKAQKVSGEPRVAVYFDFDNIVISRFDQRFGRSAFARDVRGSGRSEPLSEEALKRLDEARVSVNAVLDYAATFGTLAVCRAYADWSHPVNAAYRDDLTARAADLVQMFPLSVRRKNGADIRLAVDAMEDLFLLDDVTHVVIVAGDSDFVPLVQKVRRLGRYVVGIGVAGGTSRVLAGACDEYADYDALLTDDEAEEDERIEALAPPAAAGTAVGRNPFGGDPLGGLQREAAAPDAEVGPEVPRRRPGPLLRKALVLLETKTDEEWQDASAVKNQMLRMDPSFQEREHGFPTFSAFVKAYPGVAELDESGHNRIRRRPGSH